MVEYLLFLAKIVGVMLVVIPIILAAITVEVDYLYKAKQEFIEKNTEFKFKVLGQIGEVLSEKLERVKKNEDSE